MLWSNADFSLHCALASCKALGTGKGAYAALRRALPLKVLI